MLNRICFGAAVLAAALAMMASVALAFDESKYPDLKGQWVRNGSPNWFRPDLPKPPLTPEYQAIFEANKADMAAGGVGDVPSTFCIPQGVPMMMNVYDPMEIVVTPDITYILISHINDSYRRIYTDGRDWPADIEPSYAGYSIGTWIDRDGDGRYHMLEVETRGFKGPRAYDASGLPLHHDNQSVVRERIYLAQAERNTLYDEITVIDHALTQPYSTIKKVFRNPSTRPQWHTEACSEENTWLRIGNQPYYLSADGNLMPTKKNQSPPNLRYFGAVKP